MCVCIYIATNKISARITNTNFIQEAYKIALIPQNALDKVKLVLNGTVPREKGFLNPEKCKV